MKREEDKMKNRISNFLIYVLCLVAMLLALGSEPAETLGDGKRKSGRYNQISKLPIMRNLATLIGSGTMGNISYQC